MLNYGCLSINYINFQNYNRASKTITNIVPHRDAKVTTLRLFSFGRLSLFSSHLMRDPLIVWSNISGRLEYKHSKQR